MVSASSDSTTPGEMTVTRTSLFSRRSPSEMARTANFVPQYTAQVGQTWWPPIEERLMIWPDFRARMSGSTAAMPWRTPRMFTSIIWFHSSIFSSCKRRERHDAGVVDEDVDGAELLAREVGERLHVIEAGDVECAALGGAAGRADLARRVFRADRCGGRRGRPCARAGEHARGGFADAAAGAGDEDDFVFDVCADDLWWLLVSCGVFMVESRLLGVSAPPAASSS